MKDEIGVAPQRELAQAWLAYSLEQGSDLAIEVLGLIDQFTHYRLLVPGNVHESMPFDMSSGVGLKSQDADALALQFFQATRSDRARTLIVEDDLARRGDTRKLGRVAFVGDRVLHWCELIGQEMDCVELLRSASSGYPLNAFVVDGAPEGFGLSAGALLHEGDLQVLLRYVSTVLVGALDAETYLVANRR